MVDSARQFLTRGRLNRRLMRSEWGELFPANNCTATLSRNDWAAVGQCTSYSRAMLADTGLDRETYKYGHISIAL